MGAVEAGAELGAYALGQLSRTQTLYGVLSHLTLPLRTDGRRIHQRYPLDYLQKEREGRSESIEEREEKE